MSFRELAVATHLIGVILWIGGTATAAMIAAADRGEGDRSTLAAARRAVLLIATPGMLLAWAAGLAYLIPNFADVYARAGWMHGKLVVVLVLTAVMGVLTGRLRKAAAGTKPASAGLFSALGFVLIAGAAVAVFLAIAKPGA